MILLKKKDFSEDSGRVLQSISLRDLLLMELFGLLKMLSIELSIKTMICEQISVLDNLLFF